MSEYKLYTKKSQVEMRPYVPGEVLGDEVSISPVDRAAGSPKEGDMLARNPANHSDQWLVAKSYFEANYVAGDRPDFEALAKEGARAAASYYSAKRNLSLVESSIGVTPLQVAAARTAYFEANAALARLDEALFRSVERAADDVG